MEVWNVVKKASNTPCWMARKVNGIGGSCTQFPGIVWSCDDSLTHLDHSLVYIFSLVLCSEWSVVEQRFHSYPKESVTFVLAGSLSQIWKLRKGKEDNGYCGQCGWHQESGESLRADGRHGLWAPGVSFDHSLPLHFSKFLLLTPQGLLIFSEKSRPPGISTEDFKMMFNKTRHKPSCLNHATW